MTLYINYIMGGKLTKLCIFHRHISVLKFDDSGYLVHRNYMHLGAASEASKLHNHY